MITDYRRCVCVFRVFGFCPKKKKNHICILHLTLEEGIRAGPIISEYETLGGSFKLCRPRIFHLYKKVLTPVGPLFSDFHD